MTRINQLEEGESGTRTCAHKNCAWFDVRCGSQLEESDKFLCRNFLERILVLSKIMSLILAAGLMNTTFRLSFRMRVLYINLSLRNLKNR